MPMKYDKEFKEEAVKLAVEIGTKQASDRLGIPTGTLRTWRNNRNNLGVAHVGSGNGVKKLKDPEKERLIRENKELQRANEILKEALGFFVVSQKK